MGIMWANCALSAAEARDIVKDNLIDSRLFAERRARIKVTLSLYQGVYESDVWQQGGVCHVSSVCVQDV